MDVRQKMVLLETVKLRHTTGLVNRVRLMMLSKFFMKETSSINVMCNMFSDVYFHSHICSKGMKLIHKNTFAVQTFPIVGSP